MEIEDSKVCQILNALDYLLDKKNEWFGYIDSNTGKIVNMCEGEESRCVGGTPEEERGKCNEGLLHFHTHQRGERTKGFTKISAIPEPSGSDILATHARGCPSFTITEQGIYKLIPKEIQTIGELKKINDNAWNKAEDLQFQHGDDAYWFWLEIIKKELPVEIKKIC